MIEVILKNVEQRGNDLHADLPVLGQWIVENQTVSAEVPGGRKIQVVLHSVMSNGNVLRLKGQSLDSSGDLLLRICITDSAAALAASDSELRARKNGRLIMTVWSFGAGLVLIWGFEGWLINGVPAAWIGYICIAIGVFSLLGFNTWRGGPLDKRHDPPASPPF